MLVKLVGKWPSGAVKRSKMTLLLLLIIPGPILAQEDEIWQMEEEYWKIVQARDFEGYLRLWHQDFIGWQCAEPKPGGPDHIGDWVRDLRDGNVEVTYQLRKEAVRSFGTTALVHYAVKWAFRYPDGRVEGNETWRKITHTWIKVDGHWVIAGGMCADLAEPS